MKNYTMLLKLIKIFLNPIIQGKKMGLLTNLKKAYELGNNRLETEITIDKIYISIRRGDSSLIPRVLELREKINNFQNQYEQLGFLEKLAFDFGNCNGD